MQATERRPRLLRTPSHGRVRLQNAAPDLIELDRFEQSLEVAFAEPFMALALDDLEENGSDHIAREDLQQHLLAGRVRIAVDQNAQAADRKSTRLNSSHVEISYAVFCLKKKNRNRPTMARHIIAYPPHIKS